jgi:uncharacterized protein
VPSVIDTDVVVVGAGPAGLVAAGEASGLGGGVHGSRSLVGTVRGGCPSPGRTAGRALAAAL